MNLYLRTRAPANQVFNRPAGEAARVLQNKFFAVGDTDVLCSYRVKLTHPRIVIIAVDQLRFGCEGAAAFQKGGQQYNQLIKEITARTGIPQAFPAVDNVYIDITCQGFDFSGQNPYGLAKAKAHPNHLVGRLIKSKLEKGVIDHERNDNPFFEFA